MNLVQFVRRWRWLLIASLFALCVGLKLNGSSIGVWQIILKDPGPIRGLLLFTPKEVRFDEWAVVTPSLLSQARHVPPFPVENDNLGAGRAPLLMSMPVRCYTTLFRPQLWGFFFFDFEHAFAFYWCCKVFGLLLAAAWFFRQIGIKNPCIVAFGSVWIFFSSFVQWWFSTPAMLPEMLACWAMVTGFALKFFSTSRRIQLSLAVVGFLFFAVNFVLCMYPGFQIPLCYLFVAIVIGAWLEHRSNSEWHTKQGITLIVLSVTLLVLALTPLWWQLRDTLRILSATAYPGLYRGRGGGLSFFELFSGILGFFESEERIPFHYGNICEASNFYPLWAAVLPLVVLARLRRKIPVPPLILTLATVIFFMGIYCILPMPAWAAHGTGFGLANDNRLLLGIGLAGILLCCVFVDSYPVYLFRHGRIAGLVVAGVMVSAGLIWLRPFRGNGSLLVLIIAINALLLGLFVWDRARRWSVTLLAAMTILNGVKINPLMSGLAPLLSAPAFVAVERLHAADRESRWLIYEKADHAQMAKAAGADVFNGTKIVPDLELLRQLDPDSQYKPIYNRLADIHIFLPTEPGMVAFNLFTSSIYQMVLPPELPWLRSHGYNYVVFPRPWLNAELRGFSLVEQIEPADIYIYKRARTSE